MKLRFINRIRLVIARIIKRRNRNLCEICPDNIKGTCCYISVHLYSPNKPMCMKCPEHIKSICFVDIDKLPETSKKHNITLSNHPCKYLDITTKMCSVYTNRFRINPHCNTVKQGIPYGLFRLECIYVKKNRKYRKGIYRETFEEAKDSLCPLQRINFDLTNRSLHSHIYKY